MVGASQSDDDDNNNVTAVKIQEHGGRRNITARAFVDCSGDCDLPFYAGASTRYGNHGTVNLGSLSTHFGGLAGASPAVQEWSAAIKRATEADPEFAEVIRKDSSVLLRLPDSGDVVTYLASASYDARSSTSITEAEQEGRRQAREYLKILRQHPGHEKVYLTSTGPNFGTRESQHLDLAYQLTRVGCLQARWFGDCVALVAWGWSSMTV